MKKITVGGVLGNALCMLADLMSKLQNWVITHGQLAKFCKKEDLFNPMDNSEAIADWQLFYKNLFKKEYDFSNIVISQKPNVGRWRLLIITDLALEHIYAKCKELFPCWRWTDENLDKKVVRNERNANSGAYGIWVKDEIEADENLKDFSAYNIKVKNITTETLAERLIHELKFFDETGKHLDIKNLTLCTGSRYDYGQVPYAYWGDVHGLNVNWWDPDIGCGNLCSRQVVS